MLKNTNPTEELEVVCNELYSLDGAVHSTVIVNLNRFL